MDRGLTQWEADDSIGAFRGFINELEVGNRENSIYVLHKAYLFLNHIPRTLCIDETTLCGKLYAHRIKNGLALSRIASEVVLDKSTIGRFEKGKFCKSESLTKIRNYLANQNLTFSEDGCN